MRWALAFLAYAWVAVFVLASLSACAEMTAGTSSSPSSVTVVLWGPALVNAPACGVTQVALLRSVVRCAIVPDGSHFIRFTPKDTPLTDDNGSPIP